MPSSQFFHVQAADGAYRDDAGEFWDWTGETNWLPGVYDEFQGGLGDTSVRMIDTVGPMAPCGDGSYASSADACPTACGPGEMPVSNPDWAKPICMTPDLAVAYGRGVQAALTPDTPQIPWGLIAIGGVGLLVLGALGGRRR